MEHPCVINQLRCTNDDHRDELRQMTPRRMEALFGVVNVNIDIQPVKHFAGQVHLAQGRNDKGAINDTHLAEFVIMLTLHIASIVTCCLMDQDGIVTFELQKVLDNYVFHTLINMVNEFLSQIPHALRAGDPPLDKDGRPLHLHGRLAQGLLILYKRPLNDQVKAVYGSPKVKQVSHLLRSFMGKLDSCRNDTLLNVLVQSVPLDQCTRSQVLHASSLLSVVPTTQRDPFVMFTIYSYSLFVINDYGDHLLHALRGLVLEGITNDSPRRIHHDLNPAQQNQTRLFVQWLLYTAPKMSVDEGISQPVSAQSRDVNVFLEPDSEGSDDEAEAVIPEDRQNRSNRVPTSGQQRPANPSFRVNPPGAPIVPPANPSQGPPSGVPTMSQEPPVHYDPLGSTSTVRVPPVIPVVPPPGRADPRSVHPSIDPPNSTIQVRVPPVIPEVPITDQRSLQSLIESILSNPHIDPHIVQMFIALIQQLQVIQERNYHLERQVQDNKESLIQMARIKNPAGQMHWALAYALMNARFSMDLPADQVFHHLVALARSFYPLIISSKVTEDFNDNRYCLFSPAAAYAMHLIDLELRGRKAAGEDVPADDLPSSDAFQKKFRKIVTGMEQAAEPIDGSVKDQLDYFMFKPSDYEPFRVLSF
jgi:hypothetical protein